MPKAVNSNLKPLYGLYFVVTAFEITAEYVEYRPALIILKPLIPLMLICFYWIASPKRNILFFLAMIFSMLTNLLFIFTSDRMLLGAVVAFMIHRIIVIWFILRLLRITDYIPAVIASIPLLLIFCYLLSITNEIPETTFWLLIIQNILIAMLGGIAFSTYMVSDTKRNSWLLICGLLFTVLQFVVFIEKYYLSGMSPVIFRPIAMVLNAFAFYTFYRFVLATETSDHDSATG
ncbi:MAG TPA: hypothetical protein VF676_10870 [Flavobacterium sp.]|jgi:hypothetical protein